MNKLFENAKITAACMLAVAISDLIFLTIKDIEFGAGFVLFFAYVVISSLRKK